MGLIFADADNPSMRTWNNRVASDLAFLEWLRGASVDELDRAMWNRSGWPTWRQVALTRTFFRRMAETVGEAA